MKSLIIQSCRLAAAVLGFVASNAVLLALVATLDLLLGVPPQLSAMAILSLLVAALILLAVTGINRAPQAGAQECEPRALACRRATFLSSIVVRRRPAHSVTGEERSIYSEATF